MKNLIIIMGTAVLGAYIFYLMTGSGSESLAGAISQAFRENILT